MKAIGVLTTVIGGGVLLLAVAVGIRSLPDIKRYLRMRRM
jgi:hypothetical protein